MHSHIRFCFITSIAAASLMSSTVLAQTAQPNAGSPATTVTTTKWMTEEATGAANTSGQHYSYPDHAVLNVTKDQLKAAPAFKFSH
jgi:hypothetical protein